MKEWMLAHDKLHTVVAVTLLLWMGIAAHLWRLSKRVQKIEKMLS
ncbi:MAG: hypothetical protein NZ580_02360 [Bacteroidia bacterium]|nr:hypothetical protein [Bacteroidia bacterium]MDW8235671.1 hypothetical protein [Bacteroidia bacterium]